MKLVEEEKNYLQGETLLRSHTRLSFSCLKMLAYYKGLIFRALGGKKLLLLSTNYLVSFTESLFTIF